MPATHVPGLSRNLFSAFAISAVCVALDAVRPADLEQRPHNRIFNILYLPVVYLWLGVIGVLSAPLLGALVTGASGGVMPHFISAPHTRLGVLATTILFAGMWDLWQYGFHRSQHASRALWRTHRLHHSDRSLNSSTQARHSFGHHALSLVLYIPFLLLFGSVGPSVIAGFVLFHVYGFFNHANVRLGFGRLSWVLSGPQWHRIHHSRDPRHYDKNFAAFFPIIDVIFGTYYHPARDEYPTTGLGARAMPLDIATVLGTNLPRIRVRAAELEGRLLAMVDGAETEAQ